MTALLMSAGAAVVVGAVFAATYSGARPFSRRPATQVPRPQLTAGRAIGVARVPTSVDVRSHRQREYPAQHRSNSRAASYGRRLRAAVPNGVHRSGTPWDKLNEQRRRFTAAVRGGSR